MEKFGIDISVSNGPVNWDMIKLDPQQIKFAYIKATQGVGYADPYRFNNAYGAAYAAIQFGYFHTTSMNSEALSEAKAFRAALKELPPSSLPFVLHVRPDEVTMPADHVQLWISTFVMDMISSGYTKIMLHANAYFLNTHLPGTHPFEYLPLWMSHFSKGFAIPRGWEKIKIWQFTSKGKVAGIDTDVNISRVDELVF